MSNKDLSFLELPPEIRQAIYDSAQSSQTVVFDVSTSKPQVRRPTDAISSLPVSDKNFDAFFLVSKQFRQEAKSSLISNCKVILVAKEPVKINPSPNMEILVKNIAHLELDSSLLARIGSWPRLEKAKRVTVKHNITFHLRRSFGYKWLNDKEWMEVIRSEIPEHVNDELISKATSGWSAFNTSIPKSTFLAVVGHYKMARSMIDPRENFLFNTVYEGVSIELHNASSERVSRRLTFSQ